MEHFHIIQALCRSALSSPSSAIIRQVERLKEALEKEGNTKEARAIGSLLTSANKTCDMAPSKIQRSFVGLTGEELTPKTPLPVDKETSTPLAEIIFPNALPDEAPLFSPNVKLAIDSILNEWQHFEQLAEIMVYPSRTCLIYGAPGTGKTHLAMWMAKQINMPVVLTRLDGLMSSFLGTTSRNIGNLFSFAAKYRCVLLLDEFDAIAKLRNDPQEVGEIKRVVNTLLQSLDSRKRTGFTIGITNHETLLDPAIWRRFEVQIEIPKPSKEVMFNLIQKLLLPLHLEDYEVRFLVWCIDNSSGADAESLVRWLKKAQVLNPERSLVSLLREFALLNSGRIDLIKRSLLANADDSFFSALLEDDFKQKDIASLMNITQSSLSKQLSKNK